MDIVKEPAHSAHGICNYLRLNKCPVWNRSIPLFIETNSITTFVPNLTRGNSGNARKNAFFSQENVTKLNQSYTTRIHCRCFATHFELFSIAIIQQFFRFFLSAATFVFDCCGKKLQKPNCSKITTIPSPIEWIWRQLDNSEGSEDCDSIWIIVLDTRIQNELVVRKEQPE